MPLLYPIKRIFRTWKLFLALLIGVSLASAFFAGIDVKANLTAKQALDQQLNGINVDMEFSAQLNSSNLAAAQPDISNIEGVTDVELISRSFQPTLLSSNNYSITEYVQITGVSNSSRVYEGWLNKPSEGLGENETYVLENSALAETVKINDTIQTALQFSTPKIGNTTTVYLNLMVRGFAQLTDEAFSIASGSSFYVTPFTPSIPGQMFNYRSDLLILSWENTIQKIWDTMPETAFDTRFLISVNRDALISPWDTQASTENIRRVADEIQNTILANFESHVGVENNLENALQFFQYSF